MWIDRDSSSLTHSYLDIYNNIEDLLASFPCFEWEILSTTLIIRYITSGLLESSWDELGPELLKELTTLSNKEITVKIYLESSLNETECAILELILISVEKKITHFSVKFFQSDAIFIQTLTALLMRCDQLTHLHFDGRHTELSEEILAYPLKVCKELKSLTIDYCPEVTGAQISRIANESFAKLKHLRVISCRNFDNHVFEVLEKCRKLESLYLDFENNHLDVTFLALKELFAKCENLKTMRFYNSVLAPPCNASDGYDLGAINMLQTLFPKRQIRVCYP